MEKTTVPSLEVYPTPSYSLAVASGTTIYVSGLVALDPENNLVGKDDMLAQTEQVFRNLDAVLMAAGATINSVLLIRAYVTKREHIAVVREVRQRTFAYPYPASTTLIVAGLARPDFLVQVEAVAMGA